MPIKYALFRNYLTTAPDDYSAAIQDQVSKTKEDIIDVMIGRGSTVTKAETLSVLEEFEAAIEHVLEQGYSVKTPLFKIFPSIQGVFHESDSFDKSLHQVKLNVMGGSRVSKIAPKIEVKKVEATLPHPTLTNFKDAISNTTNDVLSIGGAGEVKGNRLKVDPLDVEQGVFFVAQDGTTTRSETIVRNKPSNLIFMIPKGLTAGEYRLEVRAKINGSKEAKVGVLNSSLQVL
ncbi:DNA-binding domain-containing protein [Reichenbachiella versicolor]|uniref:DNA-binding domain-containing protein n=1 Tax=Reichenbachiella versicolor TaxID=1821036 RepID=UPI000D6E43A4|nr:DNA-binding domain-containing protein [Reichenbachiella versicolor]